MSYELGPRTLHYRMKDGSKGNIRITIRNGSDAAMDIGDGETLKRKTAEISAASNWFSRSITLPGEDDLQVIFRLITAMDIYIQKICRDNEVELFSVIEGDIVQDLDIFR